MASHCDKEGVGFTSFMPKDEEINFLITKLELEKYNGKSYEKLPLNHYMVCLIDPKAINMDKSIANQIRSSVDSPISQEMIDRFSDNVYKGAVFPSIIVVVDHDENDLVVLAGLHRLKVSLDLKVPLIRVIVVNVENITVRRRIMVETNLRGATPLPHAVLRPQAAEWVINKEMTIQDAAEISDIPEARIRAEIAARKVINDAAAICGIEVKTMPKTATFGSAIGKLSKKDRTAAAEAAALICPSKLPDSEKTALVKRLAACQDAKERAAEFEKVKSQIHKWKPGPKKTASSPTGNRRPNQTLTKKMLNKLMGLREFLASMRNKGFDHSKVEPDESQALSELFGDISEEIRLFYVSKLAS